jgi:uncharacterized protein
MEQIFDLFFVIIFIYLIPLGLFIKYSNPYLKNYITIPVSILYIVLSFFTINYNYMPFILVVFTLYFIRKSSFARENYLYDTDDYYRYNFSIKSFDSLDGIKLVGMTLLVTLSISYITQIIFNYFNIPINEQEIVKLLRELSLTKFIELAVSGLLIAPVIEEFVFRWFLFSKLLKGRMNIIIAAIISSFIFSAGHLTLAGFLPIFSLALINCYIIEKKGFWYAVFNHFFFNFISFFSIFIQRFGNNFIR